MSARQKSWRQIALVGLIVVVAAWSLAGWHSYTVQQKQLADTSRLVQTTAETYANHAVLSLAIADESLKRLQETLKYEGETAFDRVGRIMSREETVGGAVNRMALVDKNGRTSHSYLNGTPAPSVDVSDRDYFKAFRDDPRDRILITEPILGKASGKWIILFVRPVLSDGKFAGVIFVGLDTEQFSKLVGTPKQEGLLITLLSPGGRIIARSEGGESLIGRQLEMPPEAFRSEAFDLKSPVDGITRRFAVRTTQDWGMHIIAGMDQNVTQAEADDHTRIAMLPALLLTLLLAPTVLLIRRALQQQQAAENERDKAARRSRTVLESMSEAVLLVDAKGVIIFANGAAAQWLPNLDGKRFPDALAAAGMSLVTEDGNPYAIADPLSFVCLESGLEIDDAWLMDSDPQKRLQWLAMRARPLLADDGKVSGAVITIVDRTDEHERISDAEMSRTILSRMNDAVMVTDARANILMVNSAYTRLSGYSETELIGKTANIGRSERQDSAFWAAMWQALTQQKKWSGKVWNLKKDGSEYCVWHTITAVHDLRGRVVRYVAVSRDITDQQEKEADLWRRANFDPLTGLANRTRFDDRLTQLLASATRHKQAFAVCYLDLDRFKPVNDTLGHAAGDELLRQVAQRMRTTLREEDLLARIGGDEFALLIPRVASADSALVVARKILAAIELPFVLVAGTANIGVSLGIAVCPDHGQSAEALLAAADTALYAAKAAGRNTWRLAAETGA
ncbi:MAG: hypothetical protein QG638_1770 [Pseudomonadota bacterium]|nr:hypothetical protein [Pseudomonadota bacterium]